MALDRRRLWAVTRMIGGIAVFGGVVVLIAREHEGLERLKSLSPSLVAGLASAQLLAVLLVSKVHDVLLRTFDVRLRRSEWLGLGFSSALYDLLLPTRGGVVVRSVYTNRIHGVPLKRFGAAVALMTLMSVFVIGAAGVLSSLIHLAEGGSGGLWFASVFALAAAVAAGLMGSERVRERYPAWERLTRPRRLFPIFALLAGVWIVLSFRFWVALAAAGVPVSFGAVALGSVVLVLVSALNLTPGSLGLREAAAGMLMAFFGTGHLPLIEAAVYERISQVLILVPTGLAAHWLISRRLRSAS